MFLINSNIKNIRMLIEFLESRQQKLNEYSTSKTFRKVKHYNKFFVKENLL